MAKPKTPSAIDTWVAANIEPVLLGITDASWVEIKIILGTGGLPEDASQKPAAA